MNARTPRQELLVRMAAAAATGNLDPFADELLKLRADNCETASLRIQLVDAHERTQDMRATAEAALAERNLATAALQAALGEAGTANAQLFDLAVNKVDTHAVRDGCAASNHLLALQRDVRQALHKLGGGQ